MAETKQTETKQEETKQAKAAQDNRVELYIPRGNANDDPNFTIGFNGKLYIVPKGKKSLVPREVAKEYERATRAQYIVDERIDELTEKARKEALAAGLK